HGERTVESFSGGERQRVAIARALAADPDVLLADEPTASLDRKTADSLIADLVGLVREGGKTLIAVSHDPAVHARMDRVIAIVDGRMAADSAHAWPARPPDRGPAGAGPGRDRAAGPAGPRDSGGRVRHRRLSPAHAGAGHAVAVQMDQSAVRRADRD